MPVCEKCGTEFGGNYCPNCGTRAAAAAFKNETKLSVESNLRMTENMAGKRSRIALFVAAAVLLVCGGVILALDYLVLSDGEPDLFFPLLCFVLGVFFGVFGFTFKPFMRKILKKNMQGKESVNFYSFTEEGYEVITRCNDGTQSSASGNYTGFTEAKEYQDMWLLYINKTTVFMVDKAGMTAGSQEELSALFSRMMGARYKVCRTK